MSILGFLILIVLMFLISLVYGIKIDNISYNNIYLNELYLKYDKKLILTLNKLQIETTNDNFKNKFDSLDIDITRKILGYFTEIKIETLSYDNKNIFFEYKNNTLNLTRLARKHLGFSHTEKKIGNFSIE